MRFFSFAVVCFGLSFASLRCEEVVTLDLTRAEEIALEKNQHLKEVDSLVEKARLGHLISVSDWMPQLELTSQAFQTQHDQNIGSMNKSSFMTQILMTQTLFSSDKMYNLQLTKLAYKELQLIRLSIINDILYQVRRGYYQVILDLNQIETAVTHVEVLKALAVRMEDRLRIGTATTFDVNQSQVAVSNALSVYYKMVKKLRVDLNKLAKTLGYEPGSVALEISEKEIPISQIDLLRKKLEGQEEVFLKTPVTTGLIFPSSNPRNQAEWIDHLFSKDEMQQWERIAMESRPDLRQAENMIDQAKTNVKKAQGQYLPQLEFQAQYGGEPTPYVEFPNSSFLNQNFQWGVGVVLTWNIFDSLRRERKIWSAKAQVSAQKSSLSFRVQEALEEVRNQIFSIESAIARKVSSEGNVRLADQTLAQAGEKMEIGYISIFDYQISINNFIEAKNNFLEAQFELIDSYYQLRHASGIDVNM